MADELKTLEFNIGEDLEVPMPDPIKVVLGGEDFVARCPNDWEFMKMMEKAQAIEEGLTYDIEPVLFAFFDKAQGRRIDRMLSGSNPSISLLNELKPALFALLEHYEPLIAERNKAMGQKIDPKGRKGPKGR